MAIYRRGNSVWLEIKNKWKKSLCLVVDVIDVVVVVVVIVVVVVTELSKRRMIMAYVVLCCLTVA